MRAKSSWTLCGALIGLLVSLGAPDMAQAGWIKDLHEWKVEQTKTWVKKGDPTGGVVSGHIITFGEKRLKEAGPYVNYLDAQLEPVAKALANPQTIEDPAAFWNAALFSPLMTMVGIGQLQADRLPPDVIATLKSYSTLDGVAYTNEDVEAARWISSDSYSGEVLKARGDLDTIVWDTLIVAGPGLRSATGCYRMGFWAHEVTHVHQYRRQGANTFLTAYFAEVAQTGYENAEQEIEARNVARIVEEACEAEKPAAVPEAEQAYSDWVHFIDINEDDCEDGTYTQSNEGNIKWSQKDKLITVEKKRGNNDRGVMVCRIHFPDFWARTVEMAFMRMDWWSEHQTAGRNHSGSGGGRGLIVYGGTESFLDTEEYDLRFYSRKEENEIAHLQYKQWREPVTFKQEFDSMTVVLFMNGSWKAAENVTTFAKLRVRVPGKLQNYW